MSIQEREFDRTSYFHFVLASKSIAFSLLVFAFTAATGCQSQSNSMRDKTSVPPWRNAATIDALNVRQKSIKTHLQSKLPVGLNIFYQLRYDVHSDLEYYLYTDGAFDGMTLSYTVDPINDVVTAMGCYTIGKGWADLDINQFSINHSPE